MLSEKLSYVPKEANAGGFIEARFVMAENGKQSRCLEIRAWMSKMWPRKSK